MRRITVGLVVAALALVAALPVSAGEGNKGNGVSGDPIFVTAGAGGFTELASAIQYVDSELGTGLEALFTEGTDQFTVFAPDNDAFFALYSTLDGIDGVDVDSIDDIPAPIVLAVLEYHVTEGRRFSNSVLPKGNNDKTIETIGGGTFTVNSDGEISDIFGQTAEITGPDMSASNGVVHAIDTVIVPVDLGTLLDLLGLS